LAPTEAPEQIRHGQSTEALTEDGHEGCRSSKKARLPVHPDMPRPGNKKGQIQYRFYALSSPENGV